MTLSTDAEAAVADTRPMTGKTVLVTGGISGIGKATAVGLARLGLTGRDTVGTVTAAANIRAASNNAAVDAFAVDMSSQTEVRRLAREVFDRYPRLDVLVNNVGGFCAHRHVAADGLEHTFALNHLAWCTRSSNVGRVSISVETCLGSRCRITCWTARPS